MNKMLYRKDNKRMLLIIYLLFIILLIYNLLINILNTKEVLNMYIALIISLSFIALYIIIYPFIIKHNKAPLKLEDNNLAFYISFNSNNKKLKLIMIIIDILEISLLIFLSIYYLYKIDLIKAYNIYPFIIVGSILLFNIYILIKDIIKYKSLDRIDAINGYHSFSIIDKKLLFAGVLLLITISNIGMLSVKVPHFIIYFSDMVIYEIISFILLIISLSSIFITKIYYYYFDIKQLEQASFNTMFLEEIGKGHYATVYKAYIPQLKTNYALKKLTSTDSKDLEKFKLEFEMMKSLNHPNLIKVYSIDEIKNEYIMDYCDYSLKDYILNHKLSINEKLSLINQLLDAFNYLHSNGIMHRDISWYNIMIIENNDKKNKEVILKVTDFGIAKDKKIRKTNSGTDIKGTLVDPTLSEFKNYNEQNDIYALGIMINFIYFQTESITTDDSKISDITSKCMDINLIDRYHHVSEIIDDLKEVDVK